MTLASTTMELREIAPRALDADGIATVMRVYAERLEWHRDALNRLNVYPVPDGDTGTNMSLTLASVVTELDAIAGAPGASGAGATSLARTCKAISHGSLMGARGNSGVILCQILRAIASRFSVAGPIGPREVADALVEADVAARAGVMRPVEGTILTVAAAAATGATRAAGAPDSPDPGAASLVAIFEAARADAVAALWRTPELLPVLAQAGVVDAGGAGLTVLYDAFLHVLDGRVLPDTLELPAEVVATIAAADSNEGSGTRASEPGTAAVEGSGGAGVAGLGCTGSADAATADGEADEEGIVGLRYEVMYFLEAPDDAVPGFKDVWAGIGDSIVVVGGDGLWNCHIHTDDIGGAIEAALDAGRPRDIRVTDLLDQVEEESWVRKAEADGPGEPQSPHGPAPVTSVVAVATGDGIKRIFRSLGALQIVAGGQSMNPSTEQMLEVVRSVPGSEVVILPNNKNIFPVAAQVAGLAGRTCTVVETPGIQEGFAALLEYDPEAGAEENAGRMRAAAGRVASGEVTRAVRSSDSAAGHIEAGDWIGLSRTGIESVASSMAEATCDLLAKLLTEGREIVTVIEGAGAKAAETRRITEWLKESRPDVALELHHGGQPLYPYLVSVE